MKTSAVTGPALVMAGVAALAWCGYQVHRSTTFQKDAAARLRMEVPRVTKPQVGQVLGQLNIPRLHLSVVVIEGDDDSTLKLAAGHIPGTALPGGQGNIGIAAHRDTFFRPLRNIRPHDLLTVQTPQGCSAYRVERTTVVRPENVDVLRSNGSSQLTLVTCYPFWYIGPAPRRFIVSARQTSGGC